MGRLESKIFAQDRYSLKRIDQELNEFLRDHPGYRVQCVSYIGDVCSTKRELFVLFDVHDRLKEGHDGAEAGEMPEAPDVDP